MRTVHKEGSTEFVATEDDQYISVLDPMGGSEQAVVGLFIHKEGKFLYFPAVNPAKRKESLELSSLGIEVKDLKILADFAQRQEEGR